MKKICKSCGKVFEDANYKYCPICKTEELIVEYPRQNIIDEYKSDIDDINEGLDEINNQIIDLKNSNSQDFDEQIENEFLISQLKEKYNSLLNELSILESDLKKEEKIKKEMFDTDKKNEKLYMRLYVELDDEILFRLCNHFSISQSSKETSLNNLINSCSESSIFNAISIIEKELREEAEEEKRKEFYDRLYRDLTDHEISLFAKEYPVPCARPNVIAYLVDNFSEDKIEILRMELLKKESRQKKEEEEEIKRKLEEEERKRKELEKREKRKKELSKKIMSEFSNPHDLIQFIKVLKLNVHKDQLIDVLVDYSDDKIDNAIAETNAIIKENLIKEVESYNLKECINLANYFSLDSYYKKDLLSKLEDCSIDEIRKAINR